MMPNINSACLANSSEAEDSIAFLDYCFGLAIVCIRYATACPLGTLYQKYRSVGSVSEACAKLNNASNTLDVAATAPLDFPTV
jgi:hypothetical protein